MCDVADGIDLAEGAWKARIHSLCNVGSFGTCCANACFIRRKCCGWMFMESLISLWQGRVFSRFQSIQTTFKVSSALLPIQYILRIKQLGQETDHLPQSNARVKTIWSCVCSTSTPLYTFIV